MPLVEPASPIDARAEKLERLKSGRFDVLVIGGGITGAGIARDAALRGYRTALLEQQDFAGGTSGNSARLVHGGLRYIETGEFGIVRRACAERNTLQAIAPHLVTTQPLTLSVYGDRKRYNRVRLGMLIYDALGGYRNVHGHEQLTASALAQAEPAVSQQAWVGAVRYYERRADDARLTLSTILAAQQAGALALNYAAAEGLLKQAGRVAGVAARDRVGGTAFEVRASVVVAAAGVWNDRLRAMDQAGLAPTVRPNKGIHVIVPRSRLPVRQAVDFPAVGAKRTMYVVPWGTTCLLGTTDTDYADDFETVHALPDEVDWILASANQAFNDVNLSRDDVLSTYAGLRPLAHGQPGAAYRAPREHQLSETPAGLISIAGGKLTTHRAMARNVVDAAAARLGRRAPCRTARTPLDAGAATPQAVAALQAEVVAATGDAALGQRLVAAYGTDARQIVRLCVEQPNLNRPVVAGLPYLMAEVAHAALHDMAQALPDVLIRRMRLMHEDAQQGLDAADEVAACLAPYLGWSPAEVSRQVASYRQQVALSRRFAQAG